MHATTFGSVCSGIEAASVAWHPLGWRSAWLAEIEPFPCAVLAHHYPNVPNLGDMTTIATRVLTGEAPAPDVLCGGTPCQAFSVAGKRESLADDRGNLTLKFVELANAIDLVRTRRGDPAAVIVWENVPGVLSTKDNAFGCFLAGLAGEDEPLQPPGKRWTDAGCVFGPERAVAWRLFDAQFFALAQRRRRVFVVASARPGIDPAAVLFEWDSVRRDTAPSREAGQNAAGSLTASAGRRGGVSEPERGQLIPDISQCITTGTGQRYDPETETILPVTAHTLRGEGFDASEDGTGRGTPLVPVATAIRTANTSANGHGISPELAHTLDRAQGQCVAFPASMSQCAISENVALTLVASNPTAVAYTTGEQHGRMDGRTPQSPNDLPSGAVRSLRRAGCRGASQERELEGPQAGELAAPVQKLSHEGAQVGEEMHALRQPAQGSGLLRYALPEVQKVGRPDGGEGQPVHVIAEGLRPASAEGMPGAGLHGEVPREGLLQQACPAGAPGNAGPATDDQIRGVPRSMAVRRLLPEECEALQGFPRGYTRIPGWNGWRAMDATETPEQCIAEGIEVRQNKRTGKWRVKDVDGPRYKALGNSWAVPCARWIGQRIQRAMRGAAQ